MAENLSGFQIVRYTRCCNNFGKDIGCIIVDGCQEFSPCEINDMLCAACTCHRNFHLPEVSITVPINYGDRFSLDNLLRESQSPSPSQPPPPPAVEGSITNEDVYFLDLQGSQPPPPLVAEAGGAIPKRTKTRFTDEHRTEMQEFAEKTGWQITKKEQAIIEEFCQKIGILPKAYKHWVKNNKGAQRKRG